MTQKTDSRPMSTSGFARLNGRPEAGLLGKRLSVARVRWPFASLFVLGVPAALAVLGVYSFFQLRPFYAGVSYHYDPAYIYLLNGLSMLAGEAPLYVDHPGTPLHVVVAVLVALQHWVKHGAPTGVVDAVLADPDAYLSTISLVLLAANVVAFSVLGWRTYRATGSIAIAVAAQSAPLFLGLAFPRLVYLSPEALLLAFAALLLAIMAQPIFGLEKRQLSPAASVLAGFVAGLAVACKITFAPVLALLLLTGSIRTFVIAGVSTAVGLGVGLIPIYPHLAGMFRWFASVASHTGHYGGGSSGFIDLATIPGSLREVWIALPIVYLGLVASAAGLVYKLVEEGEPSSTWWSRVRVPLTLILVVAGQLSLALKHFQPHYLLPAVPVAGLAGVWVVWTIASSTLR